VNLAGREAAGIVDPADYATLCDDVSRRLVSLRTADRRPVVARVVRTAESADAALRLALPDLVVHWTDAALADPLVLHSPRLESRPLARKLSGQHDFDGFYLFAPWGSGADRPLPADLAAEDLHVLFAQLLGMPAVPA
jgi:predicted AlkP superfamily phosphohydrolase/phosphomutase